MLTSIPPAVKKLFRSGLSSVSSAGSPGPLLIKLINVILLSPHMGDDITYLDILVLKKIDSESTLEKFSMKINTSFFDTANMLGSMKIKGLLDIQSSIGGQSPIVITGEGKDVISAAIQKAGEPIDTLDQTILNALVSGVRDLQALQKVINIRSRDLAFHLYKLKAYDYIDQTVQSARVNFSLTEKGFLLTKGYRSTIKAADIAKANVPAQPAAENKDEPPPKKSGSIEDEIKDLFNFKSFSKPKEKQQATMKPNLAARVQPGPPQAPAQSTAQTPAGSQGSAGSQTSAQSPPGSQAQSRGPSNLQAASSQSQIRSQPSESFLPPFMRKAPAKKEMDRQKMFMSKLEFYVQKYAIFALLVLIMLILIVFAVVFVFISS
ncbi:MAG: hypothetical protein V1822_00075 [Candidatus Micrarchaeota archaeon]